MIDVFGTFLDLDRENCLDVYEESWKALDVIKNIFICVPKMLGAHKTCRMSCGDDTF